jgi:hypothetical protein
MQRKLETLADATLHAASPRGTHLLEAPVDARRQSIRWP